MEVAGINTFSDEFAQIDRNFWVGGKPGGMGIGFTVPNLAAMGQSNSELEIGANLTWKKNTYPLVN